MRKGNLKGFESLTDEITYEKFAKIFDHSGALGTMTNGNSGLLLYARVHAEMDTLNTIKKFMKYGTINADKPERGIFKYHIEGKENIFDFLMNIVDYLELRKPMVEYILNNYNFKKSKNENFNVEEFEEIKNSWIQKVREKRLLARKELLLQFKTKVDSGEELSREEKQELESKELQGGEEI